MRGQIILDTDDRIDFISGVFFDITHQKEMEARLRESEARFRTLLEYLPGVAVQGYELDGKVRYWNRASELIYGYDAKDAIGKDLCSLIIPADLQPLFQRCLQLGAKAVKSGELMPSTECQLRSQDGALVPVHCIHTVVCLEGSPPLMFCINVDLRERQRVEAELRNYRDHLERLVEDRTLQLTLLNQQLLEEIGERQRTEEALRESELRFRSIFEGAPIGIGLLDLEGRDLELNPAVRCMLGYSREEMPHLRHRRTVHPDDIAENRRLHQELVAGTRDSFHRECRFLRRDGNWMWGLLHVSLVRDEGGEPLFTIAMVEDITAQKAVQAEIGAYQERLRSLASELSLTEERERRRLATDLHDHIGQILALAQIKLGAVRHELDSPPLAEAVGEVRDFIGEAIRYTRTLTFELSLPILYDLGLEAAVEWLAEQFHSQYGLTVEVRRDHFPLPLAEASRVLLFRTVRELLTNVVKHAQAHIVRINLSQSGNRLRLEVADDGRGFPVAKDLPAAGDSNGFGLFSIRERLSHLGGHLDVVSTLGQGTKVTVDVPLTQTEAEEEEAEG
jgi:PAS domain S-box-containing protein